jgi:hypothetical protein
MKVIIKKLVMILKEYHSNIIIGIPMKKIKRIIIKI